MVVMDFRLGQSLLVALLQYYFGRRFGESFLFWVDHEGRPYVIRYILVDGWGLPLWDSFQSATYAIASCNMDTLLCFDRKQ